MRAARPQAFPAHGEKSLRAAGGRKSEGSFSAAVEKPEDQRKPERFFGHRKADRWREAPDEVPKLAFVSLKEPTPPAAGTTRSVVILSEAQRSRRISFLAPYSVLPWKERCHRPCVGDGGLGSSPPPASLHGPPLLSMATLAPPCLKGAVSRQADWGIRDPPHLVVGADAHGGPSGIRRNIINT